MKQGEMGVWVYALRESDAKAGWCGEEGGGGCGGRNGATLDSVSSLDASRIMRAWKCITPLHHPTTPVFLGTRREHTTFLAGGSECYTLVVRSPYG